MKTYFITGTDTDCGKTYVTCRLVEHLQQKKKSALAIKPVASGCLVNNDQLENADLLKLQQYNHANYPINGWQFVSPVSPHLAAKEAGKRLSSQEIADFCCNEQFSSLDYLLVEGAGGLLVPLNEEETWLDFLKLTQIPVIVVVAMRLGCLNHALLTDSVLKTNQIHYAGWVANCLDKEMLALSDNISTLSAKMYGPLLATLSYEGSWINNFD
ncbi:dethiobiotin synthase [Legionella fairfieldensis]|uniref:dethiobiotin synthase n=1 Tax=Legionella fairfieldensis TaxID=45064 RepID=UPI00048B3173|nr:dethiobiotin synthase [Legionella fairfieldensis]